MSLQSPALDQPLSVSFRNFQTKGHEMEIKQKRINLKTVVAVDHRGWLHIIMGHCKGKQ